MNILQSTKGSIGEIIPSLLILFSTWKRIIVEAKKLLDNLIFSFELKFQYEFESENYLAASVMEVSQMLFLV